MSDDDGESPASNAALVELKLPGFVGVRLTGSAEDSGSEPDSDIKEQVLRDLRRIAVAPSKLIAEILEGLARLVRIVTLGGLPKQRRIRPQQSRNEALCRLQQFAKDCNGQIVEGNGMICFAFPTESDARRRVRSLPAKVQQCPALPEEKTELLPLPEEKTKGQDPLQDR